MNDLQRALFDAMTAYVIDRRVIDGHRLTKSQRAIVVRIALELGVGGPRHQTHA